MKRLLLITYCCILILTAAPVQAMTEQRTIPTRSGVTLNFLFMTSDICLTTSRDAIIIFPGGNGHKSFKILDGGGVQGWNFLVRSAEDFVRTGITVIVADPPSDNSTGMSTGFRESPEHAEDIYELINYLELLGFERIFLAGNSRGTISAASIAGRRDDSRIKGVILTSSLEYDNFMRYLPLEKIRQPVLMVHHREDACRVSEFSEAERTRDFLKITTNVKFVEANGGTTPMTLPCDNLSNHGFFGVEQKVIRVIIDWVNGVQVPERIE